MKTLLTAIILMTSLSASYASAAKAKKFQVTVINLTKGQPITPPVLAVHAPSFGFFTLGDEATEGLKVLAQDGITETLIQELEANKLVKRNYVGPGVIMPGAKQTITIEANDSRFKLSVVAMLARTNDAILSIKLPTRLKVGQEIARLAQVYDAGAENNTESCATIPAPPCNNPNVGTGGGEGFVRPHEGIIGVGELDLSRDSFSSTVAKVKIKRIQ